MIRTEYLCGVNVGIAAAAESYHKNIVCLFSASFDHRKTLSALLTVLMHIQFFYSTSHFTQLLHHPIFFIITLIPLTNAIVINPISTHKVASLEKQISTFEELKFMD